MLECRWWLSARYVAYISSAALESCSRVRKSGFVHVNVWMFTCVVQHKRNRLDASSLTVLQKA